MNYYSKLDDAGAATLPLLTEDQVRAAFDNQAFPETFTAPAGYVHVSLTPQPSDITMDYNEAAPLFSSGVWAQQWVGTPSAVEVVQERQAQARADLWLRIQAKRDWLIDQGGYAVSVEGTTKWFHSDVRSQIQQQALFSMGAQVPPVQWKTMDGTFVTMNQAWAAAVFTAAAAQAMAIFSNAEALRAQINAAWDPVQVNLNAGWPAVFAGVSSYQAGE